MAVHYFHCTDGVDLIVDRAGREAGPRDDLRAVAREVARDVMRAVPAFDEWDGWAVHVYDARGEVEVVTFREEAPVAA